MSFKLFINVLLTVLWAFIFIGIAFAGVEPTKFLSAVMAFIISFVHLGYVLEELDK